MFSQKKKAQVIGGLILLLIGLSLLLYPWVDRYLQKQQQLRLLAHWEHQQQEQNITLSSTDTHRAGQTFQKPAEPEATPSWKTFTVDGQTLLGTIAIEKINLLEPILAGSTEKSLRIGVGTVEPNRQVGKPGNFVLAGHRSWTPDRQFSRLDELADGDAITISTEETTYTYAVTSKFLVTPDDLSVLAEDGENAEITLITCEPAYNPTHRLIVKARLQENLDK